MKRILLFILTCALIIPVAAAEDSCANWARDEISQAAQLRIIPSEIQEFQTGYQENITRGEFTYLLMNFLAIQYNYDDAMYFATQVPHCDKTGERLSLYTGEQIKYFKDCQHVQLTYLAGDALYYSDIINWASLLGIVNGRSEDNFDPDGQITREEAAAMLMRTYRFYAGDFSENHLQPVNFQDSNSISSWAKQDVAEIVSLGVMNGIDSQTFAPKAYYTKEQSYVTLLRLYQNAPISRARGNIIPLVNYETALADALDGDSSYDSFTLVFRADTDLCTIVYGTHGQMMGRWARMDIIYKEGGVRTVDGWIKEDSIYLSDDDSLVYFTTASGEAYCIDLQTATRY